MTLAGEAAALAVAGLVAGTINVVAGGGSFLTLPLLLFLGLPAAVANATNRVGVLAQNLSGVWGYHRHGALDWRWATRASLPAVAGAALGAWSALRTPDFAFTRLLSILMIVITLWSLWRRHAGAAATGRAANHSGLWVMAGFFVTGFYGGFVQAGVGFFILGLTSAAGLDLVRGNAVKVWGVLLMTLLSLAIFAHAGTVDWARGAALGAGNFTGGLVGVRLAILKGHHWLERVVTATILVFALLLWVG